MCSSDVSHLTRVLLIMSLWPIVKHCPPSQKIKSQALERANFANALARVLAKKGSQEGNTVCTHCSNGLNRTCVGPETIQENLHF
jgi:hypothetical protein